MGGRRQPVSWTPESEILKPVDPALDRDSWPIFFLTDVVVYRPDGVTMANALMVDVEGPFTIRGRLELDGSEMDDEIKQCFVRPDTRSTHIQIDGSIYYSVGYDPLPIVWLSGKAGWFQISPQPCYERIYQDMCDVSVLYHMLMEIYNAAAARVAKSERKNVYMGLSAKTILFEYAVAVGDGITYDELVDKCVRLAPSLLSHLSKMTEFPWKATSFVKWLNKEIQDRNRIGRRSGRGTPVADPQSRTSSASPAEPPQPTLARQSSSSLSQQLPLRTTPKSQGEAPHPPTPAGPAEQPPSDADDAASAQLVSEDKEAVVFRLFLSAILEINQESDNPYRLSQSAVHGQLFSKFRLSYPAGKDLSAYFSKALIPALGPKWLGSGYMKWLEDVATQPFQPLSANFALRDMPTQLQRRTPTSALGTPRNGSVTPSSRQPRHATMAGKGVAPLTPSQRLRQGGKHAALRLPSSLPKKRPYGGAFADGNSNDSSDADGGDIPATQSQSQNGRPHKTARNGSNGLQDAADDEDMVDHDDDDSDDGDNNDDDDDNYDDDDESTTLILRAEPLLQSTEPTGPNRTWRCAQPGCDFYVRDAGLRVGDDDEDDGGGGGGGEDGNSDDGNTDLDNVRQAQARVRQHLQTHLQAHKEARLTKVDLAIAEGSQRHVSVNHLLDKIRGMGDHSRRASLSSSAAAGARAQSRANSSAPLPITRQFLV